MTAPGVNVLAALAGTQITGSEDLIGQSSGSSMAAAHTAGAATLIRQAHPTWTAAEIKSALMMSASTQVLRPDQVSPADTYSRGSGRLRLERAIRSGLVMHETTANFSAANPGSAGQPHTLNLASMGDNNCFPSCQFTRTFRNGQTSGSLWRVEVVGLPGTVNTQLMWVPAGASRSVTVTIDGNALPANGSFNFGTLSLTKMLSGAQSDAGAALSLPIGVSVPPPIDVARRPSTPPSTRATTAAPASASATSAARC